MSAADEEDDDEKVFFFCLFFSLVSRSLSGLVHTLVDCF